ncbi:hypothetical protein QBC46DRAFT_462242 [Diplogelasinospora grovesii]|uniref:Uncharacterized protein n=1 Tax=Diplogelasinospora grovesii TaxID=303347 RepID=A0AAN6RZ22_9PEZI|nr:hypothetical protein QBC46DRAFT_462242 [Diplogelasinospora grovesii]
MFGTPNCTIVPKEVASDAGIAGEGVLLSFIVTAGLALVMSATLVLQEFRQSTKPSTIRRKLINGYSDQQIIVGIGIQSVGLAKVDTLVPYHFFIIWMLSLLSMATHNATLLTLVRDFRRDWVLRWLRQFLMFVNLVLSCVYGVFVLQSKIKGLPNTLPIGCVWTLPDSNSSGVGSFLDYIGTIITIAGNCVVFGLATWYLHSREQRFYKIIQLVGMILMASIAIGATIRVLLLSQAFGNPDVALGDQGEKSWSFGQVLSILMLILPGISAVEILRGEIEVTPLPEDSFMQPLFEGQLLDNPKIINRY